MALLSDEDDVYETAALRFLRGRLPNVQTIWPSRQNIDWVTQRLVELNEFIPAVKDQKMRRACQGWVNYTERQLKEAKRNLEKSNRVNAAIAEAIAAQKSQQPEPVVFGAIVDSRDWTGR